MNPRIGDPVRLPGRNGIYMVVDVDEARGSVVVVPAGECWAHTPRVVALATITPVEDRDR